MPFFALCCPHHIQLVISIAPAPQTTWVHHFPKVTVKKNPVVSGVTLTNVETQCQRLASFLLNSTTVSPSTPSESHVTIIWYDTFSRNQYGTQLLTRANVNVSVVCKTLAANIFFWLTRLYFSHIWKNNMEPCPPVYRGGRQNLKRQISKKFKIIHWEPSALSFWRVE